MDGIEDVDQRARESDADNGRAARPQRVGKFIA